MSDGEELRAVNSLVFTALPPAVSLSRALVRFSLKEWDFLELADDAETVISEIVTNAVQATDSHGAVIRISVSLHKAVVLVSVIDQAKGVPELERGEIDDEGGRGLLLVGVLSSRWGYYELPDRPGKVVWAELRLPHEPVPPYDLPRRMPSFTSPVLVHRAYDRAILQRVLAALERL